MADSDQAVRDIVAQIVSNGTPPAPVPSAAPVGVMPAPGPSTIPGPGGYSAADRFNKFSLPAGGGPLSVADAQKVIDSYESTGGHAFAPVDPNNPSVRSINVGGYAMPLIGAHPKASPADNWAPPAPIMTAPTIAPLGAMASIPKPRAPKMGALLAMPTQ